MSKKDAAQAEARVDAVLDKIASAERAKAAAETAVSTAVAQELEAREALQDEHHAAVAVKVTVLIAERLAPAAERRDRALKALEDILADVLQPALDELEIAETALHDIKNECSKLYYALGDEHGVAHPTLREIAPMPSIRPCYHSPGKIHGIRMINGGRMTLVRDRWALLFAAKRVRRL